MPAMTDPAPKDAGLLDLRIQTACFLIITTILVALALFWLKSVMIPFVLALFLAAGLAPLADFQIRWLRFPKALAVFMTFLVSMALLALSVAVVSSAVAQLAASASAYQDRLGHLLDWAARTLPLEHLGVSRDDLLRPLSRLPSGTVSGFLLGTTNAILELTSQGLLVTVFLVFLLIGLTGQRSQSLDVWTEMESRVKGFIVMKTLISAVTGVLVGVTLELLGVELALAFGFFAFLLNFIPTLGSLISTLLPLPVVLMNPELSTTGAILAIVIPGAIHFAIGNLVEPLVMGDSLELHPVALLLSLMIWGAIWGVVGMLLAAPITAVLKILSERIEPTRPLGRMLAGHLRD
ncbi:MAG: AI-2E family transporter [Deltaproteobacteria bacterium]|nr:AI-2E family transporter [Deltaproteobacteria bacterium]